MSDDFYGDVTYEVWRSGGNPDSVSRDEVADYKYDGYRADEVANAIMSRERVARQRRMEAEAEQEYEDEEPNECNGWRGTRDHPIARSNRER